MSESHNEKVLALFHRALDLPPAERQAFVIQKAAEDLRLRDDVLELLHQDPGSMNDPFDDLEPDRPDVDRFLEQLPGRIDHFELQELLARGGTSVVFKARQLDTRQLAAIKILFPFRERPGMPNIMRREIEALCSLQSPGIARVLASGTFETSFGYSYYLVMEHIDGRPLPEYLAAESPTLPQRVELLAQLCDIVDHAHLHGVVHRDIKPENILVRPDRTPVLLDFGLARLPMERKTSASMQSVVGQLIGTVRYMSPEQARADPSVDRASDIYTLGVFGYELLTEVLPYQLQEDNVPGSIVAIQDARPKLAGDVNRDLQGGIERALAKALAKEPRQRQASAGQLGRELRAGIRERRRPYVRAWERRSRSERIALVATVTAALAILGYMVLRQPQVAGWVVLPAGIDAGPVDIDAVDPTTDAVLATTSAGADGWFRLDHVPPGVAFVVRARTGNTFAATRQSALGRNERRSIELAMLSLPSGCAGDSLVAWWPGDRTMDDVVGGHAARSEMHRAFTAGPHRDAFVFDAACPAGLAVADAPAFRNPHTFTIEAWVRPTYATDPRIDPLHGIFGRGAGCDQVGSSYSFAVVKRQSDAAVVLWLPDSTGVQREMSGPTASMPRDGFFHHIAATYDGTTARIYVDGQNVLAVANPNSRYPAEGRVRIGHHPECSSVTHAAIDELRFFRRALGASEIASIHASGEGKRPEPVP